MNPNIQAPSHQTIDRGTQTELSIDSNLGKFLRLTVKRSLYENYLWDARKWRHSNPDDIQRGPGLLMRRICMPIGVTCGLAAARQMSLGPLGIMGSAATGLILGGQAGYLAEAAFIRECQRLQDLEKAVTTQPQGGSNLTSSIPRNEDRTNAPPSYDESEHNERLRRRAIIRSDGEDH
ncbi:hypothetical protein [Endozoicomonas sp. 4G]|uniref:hypothetical protein n=1 Tax=Endozoicomonas sp. 4G TaxID=2872754 RepID=UPI002078F1A6|nr:hypothetical protein [Endozoicomonas sp. 4G]